MGIDFVSLATALFTAGGVIVMWKQTQKISHQMRLQHFAEYTKRYQEICLHFPENINKDDFKLEGHKDYDIVMRYMRAYHDLCYEEWLLHQKKLLDEQFWNIWKGGIETAFSKSAFRQAWSIIKQDTQYGSEFSSFLNKLTNPN